MLKEYIIKWFPNLKNSQKTLIILVLHTPQIQNWREHGRQKLGIWLAGILAMSLQTSCKYLDCIIFIAMWLQTLNIQLFFLQSLCDQGQSLRVCCKFARGRTNVRNELAKRCKHLRTRIYPLCKHNCLRQVCSRLAAGLLQTFQFRKGYPLCNHNCLRQVCSRLAAGLLQTFQFRKG